MKFHIWICLTFKNLEMKLKTNFYGNSKSKQTRLWFMRCILLIEAINLSTIALYILETGFVF